MKIFYPLQGENDMNIRTAKKEDLSRLLDIYNYEVENGVATFDLQPKSFHEFEEWFLQHNIENHPLIVAETDHDIAGYASLSSYRTKEAYYTTVELSVYIDPGFRKQGVATKLMEAILKSARECDDIHMVVSVITGGNEASVRLHEKFGFTYCGRVHEVGIKFGRYLDIDHYELRV